MNIFNTVAEMQEGSTAVRRSGKTIAFVPTMGALHAGHASLLQRGRSEADHLVLSIFVNPTQFGKNEDLEKYPRTFDSDLKIAEDCGVDVVFAPTAGEIYPRGFQTFVQLKNLPNSLCGIKRPGHFCGVTTIVLKLFHIVQPDIALFGRKDYQQLRLIEQMTADLHLPIRILPCDIVRESDGLAISSRNCYLSAVERETAVRVSQSLKAVQTWIHEGDMDTHSLENRLIRFLSDDGKITVDYATLCDPETLEPLKRLKKKSLLAIACFIGKTRLIDNGILNLKEIL